MRVMKLRRAVAGLFCLSVFSTGTAVARIHLSIGLGTSFGHYYPYYRGCGYGHYGWYGSYYGPWWRHSHWPEHYWPGSSFSVHYSSPIVLSPRVSVKAPAENPRPEPQPQLSQSMQAEQSELLKILRIGDKENRIAVIRELALLYFDDKARAALENALLTHADPEIRREVATSLGKTQDANVTAALRIAKAKDPDRGVRQAAYRSLIMIEGY